MNLLKIRGGFLNLPRNLVAVSQRIRETYIRKIEDENPKYGSDKRHERNLKSQRWSKNGNRPS